MYLVHGYSKGQYGYCTQSSSNQLRQMNEHLNLGFCNIYHKDQSLNITNTNAKGNKISGPNIERVGPFPPIKSGRWVVGWLGGSVCVGTCQWSSTVGYTPLSGTRSEVRHAADFKIISTNWLKNWKKYLVIRSIFQLVQNDRYLRLNHRANDSPNRREQLRLKRKPFALQ